jgi:hypothetical protein
MTNQQIINQAINYAYKIGDKDECFCKHVAHTISAIYVGNGYQNINDYKIDVLSSKEKNQIELDSYWKEAENVCKEIGADNFFDLVRKNKYYETDLSYFINLEDSYYITSAKERKIYIEKSISDFNKIKQKFQKYFNQELLEDFQIIENEFQYNIENGNDRRNEEIMAELKFIARGVKPNIVDKLETNAVINKFKRLVY